MAITDPPPAESDDTTTPVAEQPHHRWVDAGRARVDTTRDQLQESRRRYRPVNVAFSLSEHDIATGGALMAGALAFRLFLWSLPAALLGVGILGYHSDTAGADASKAGLGKLTAATIGQAAQDAHRGRLIAVVVGAVLLCGVSLTLAKTISVATALIWRLPVPKLHRPVRTVALTVVSLAIAIAFAVAATWLRKHSPGLGLLASIFVGAVWTALWWLVSSWLPHPPHLPWWGLLPGAAFVGVAADIIHIATVYYFSPKIASSSSLYGSLGFAATLLLWTYVVCRVVLAAAGLNLMVSRVYGAPVDDATAAASGTGR